MKKKKKVKGFKNLFESKNVKVIFQYVIIQDFLSKSDIAKLFSVYKPAYSKSFLEVS